MTYTADSLVTTPATGTPAQWVQALQAHDAQEASRIVAAYFRYAPIVGLNADLALAQACVECAWFTDWKWTQNYNPAGLGSTSRQTPGASFPSIEAGITAQLAHLCAYAYTAATCPVETMGDEYADLFNDPRHALVGHRGHPELSYLNGRWAVPGTMYAQSICAVANAVVGSSPSPPSPGAPVNIIDIRDQLPTNPSGGSQQTEPNKKGTVLHYSAVNYAADRSMMDILTSEANFHIGPYLGEAGLAYHYSVDPQTGEVYLCRDEDAVLWHCGYWGTPGNANGVAVHVPGGSDLVMSDAGVAGLVALLGYLEQKYGYGHDMLKGHQEVSPTACPGPLMQQIVLPYRAGQLVPNPLPPPIQPDDFLHLNGFIIGGGFKRRYLSTPEYLPAFGLPTSDEMQATITDADGTKHDRTVQFFERDVFQFESENAPPFDVTSVRRDQKVKVKQ